MKNKLRKILFGTGLMLLLSSQELDMDKSPDYLLITGLWATAAGLYEVNERKYVRSHQYET